MSEPTVSRERVLAFRAATMSLDARRPRSDLVEVAGACGIQDTPPGNADVSLAARLDIDGPVVGDAVENKEAVLTWAMRGAPHLVPPADHAVFTLGVAPADGTRQQLWGQPEHALVEVEKAMMAAVGSSSPTKAEVSGAVTRQLPAELAPWCKGCDVHHPDENVFRAAPLLGRLVLTGTAPVRLARARTWVGAEAKGDVEALRRELLVRFLHCYGPTTSGHFAEWAGITKTDARQRWTAVADALVAVRVDGGDGGRGHKAFVLEADLAALEGSRGSGVRLLPAKDPFLQSRDRDLLFREAAHRKRAFPVIGGPGVVLSEAVPVGTWRGAAKSKRYDVTVEPFGKLSKAVLAQVEAEAERLAHVRGHSSATVVSSVG